MQSWNESRESGYLSSLDPLCSIERLQFEEGRAKGVSTFCAHNAAGLDFSVLIDRGFDIGNVRVKGSLVNYISAAGVTHPAFFQPEGTGWLRSFGGGLLTTCGYLQAGEPCEEGGELLGLHGRIANLPTDHVCSEVRREGARVVGSMRGIVREACHQKENLIRVRTIWFEDRINTIHVHDEVTNFACSSSPFMVIYHFNFGFPFLRETARLYLPLEQSAGWDAYSAGRTEKFGSFPPPEEDAREILLLHNLKADGAGNTTLLLANETLGVQISYNTKELPRLAQWKLPRRNDYILGIEPCNNHLRGRAWERENGTLRMIEPGETIPLDLKISFLEAQDLPEALWSIKKL